MNGEAYKLYYKCDGFYISYCDDKYSIKAPKNTAIIDLTTADLDNDEIDEILVLVGEIGATYSNDLIIYKSTIEDSRIKTRESYRNNMAILRPWKLKTCDIDNDGECEIFIAVNKATRYYTEIENRPFFFNFKEGMLIKKWTGTKLRAPFIDIYFADVNNNGSDEFIVIEEAEHGGYLIAVYYWFGFGFILQAESASYDAINSVSVVNSAEGTTINARVRKNNRTNWVTLLPSMDITKNQIYLLKEKG